MRKKPNNQVILEKEDEVSLVSLNDQGSFNSLSGKVIKRIVRRLKGSRQG